jgi:hypothetical protein
MSSCNISRSSCYSSSKRSSSIIRRSSCCSSKRSSCNITCRRSSYKSNISYSKRSSLVLGSLVIMKQETVTWRGGSFGHGVKEQWARAGSPGYRGLRAEAGNPRYGAPKLGRQVKALGLTARPGQTKLNISLNNICSQVKKSRKPCKNTLKCENSCSHYCSFSS